MIGMHGQPASFSPATTTVLLDNATTLKVRGNVPLGTPPTRRGGGGDQRGTGTGEMRVKVIASP